MAKNKQTITYSLILLISALVAISMALSTRWGPGIGGDATIYITSARNLLTGRGLGLLGPRGEFRFLPYFPPFFSLVLSLVGCLGLDLVTAARWLNILCFAGLACLSGCITYRFSQSSFYSILLTLFIGFSPVLIPVYSWAMSEPLSAILGFGGLVLVVYAIKHPERNQYLITAALLCGLSFLTRYAALAFIITGALGLLFLGKTSPISRNEWVKRLVKTVKLGAISILPMLIWLICDVLNTTTVGSRRVLTATEMLGRFYSFWPLLKESILFWVIPESWFYQPVYPVVINTIIVPAVLLILLIWGLVLLMQLRKKWDRVENDLSHLFILLGGFSILYLFIIFGVYLSTYPPITIANRMLSPIHTAALWLVVLMAILTDQLLEKKQWVRWGLRGLLLVIILFYGWRSVRIVKDYYQDGLGYTSLTWQQSQTIEALRKLPADRIIVTNETNAILFLTGRLSYPLMEIYTDSPVMTFYRYGDGDLTSDQSQQLFHDGKAVLVLFDTIDDQISGLYGDRTAERISALVKGLDRRFRGEDGGIFYYPEP